MTFHHGGTLFEEHTHPAGLALPASITTEMLANGSVTAAKLATGAVTSAKILDGTIATADIANAAVTADKLDPALPKGVLGRAEITVSQGSITTTVDVTGLSVTVTVSASRMIRITAWIRGVNSTVAGDFGRMDILEGATLLGTAQQYVQASNTLLPGFVILTPTAGSHTYKIQYGRTAGSGTHTVNATSNSPSFILVEDIGPA
jgi:hypothetical protein